MGAGCDVYMMCLMRGCFNYCKFVILLKVFELLMSGTGTELVGKLQENTSRFRNKMTEAGFTLSVSVLI